MAKCPGCEGDVRWDWCQDLYWVDRSTCDLVEIKSQENIEDTMYSHMLCPRCTAWLGVLIEGGPCNGTIINHPSFENINWEEEEHTLVD